MNLTDRLATDRGVWIGSFLLVFVMSACWALASPYNAVPDEPAHAMRAWSVVHGQVFASRTNDPEVVGGVVKVPPFYAHTDPACFAFQPERTADCQAIGLGGGTVEAATTAARAPVYVYAVVGLPTLVLSGGDGYMAMRLWQAALCAALLASACVSARRRWSSRWMPVGVIVAVTPMVLYLAGAINPSGLEIAAAIGVWVSGLALVAEEEIDRRVLLRFVIAAAVVAGCRQLGPLMVLLIVAALCAVGGMGSLRRLLRSRQVQVGAVAVSLVAVLMVCWVITQHTFATSNNGVVPPTISDAEMWKTEVWRIGYLFRQGIGWFGWLDSPAPAITYLAWILALGTLLVVGLSLAQRRIGLTVLTLIAVIIVLPLLVEVPNFRVSSFAWQGRYTLPLLVGVPLLCAHGLARARVARPAVTSPGMLLVAGLLWVGSVLAHAQTLRRFSVGANGGLFFWRDPVWSPSVPILVLLVVFVGTAGAWIWFSLSSGSSVDPPRGLDAAGTDACDMTVKPADAQISSNS
jgi:hypothetical protein